MSAVEGGHVTNIGEANDVIRQIVEARNKLRHESTDAVTVEEWEETADEITESLRIDAPPVPEVGGLAENPKDIVGSGKLPLHLWPTTATATGCIAMLNGALKYGRSNWRKTPVKASIYVDACHRHIAAWFEGHDEDEEGVPHLSSALACLAIIVDAQAAGTLVDDRQVSGGHVDLVDSLTPHVRRLRQRHAGRSPKHWTIADN